jgi:NAD(P)-dependent dehydrogenase (short-subunit alcohol dehydrogenase family)
MGMEQKVAVITGASGGIGAALVKAYREPGMRISGAEQTGFHAAGEWTCAGPTSCSNSSRAATQ